MRTTVRLPDDLYAEVRIRAATDGGTVTSFIEEALRAALRPRDEPRVREPYRVSSLDGGGLRSGVDLDDGAALLDLMDDDARS